MANSADMDDNQYVALFRGLNVGGKSSVSMRDLRQLFQDLDFGQVRSYIQSGNVCFRAQGDGEAIRQRLRDAFTDRFGFESPVVLRSAEEMAHIVAELPFSAEEVAATEAADPQVAHLYVCFLNAPLEDAQTAQLRALDFPGERLREDGPTLYLLLKKSIRESKLAAAIARVLPEFTMRNWNTTRKLARMLAAEE